MNRKRTIITCCVVLLAGMTVTALIFLTEPTAERTGAVRETAMLVDVVAVERGTYRPTVVATGTVVPSQDVTLSPRVGGEIFSRSPSFTPGGYAREGEPLLQIDPSDYENVLVQRRTDLSLARSEYSLEMGRQDVARRDYELLGDTVDEEGTSLALRGPQLQAAQARIAAAEAAVDQAELDLRRTTIRAPFDAHILRRNVNVGSQVAPGDDLGRLVGLDMYWVEISVPLSHLRWLDIPSAGNTNGSRVIVWNRTAWAEGVTRTGYLFRLVGSLEDQTRMARVIAAIPDPLAYRAENAGSPALIIGSFVEASIEAREVEDVVRLDRDYVRSNDTVWLMEDGRLLIRDVLVAFRDPTYAYIADGLDDGDHVVTTNLSTVVEGARLRLDGDSGEPEQEPTEEVME